MAFFTPLKKNPALFPLAFFEHNFRLAEALSRGQLVGGRGEEDPQLGLYFLPDTDNRLRVVGNGK